MACGVELISQMGLIENSIPWPFVWLSSAMTWSHKIGLPLSHSTWSEESEYGAWAGSFRFLSTFGMNKGLCLAPDFSRSENDIHLSNSQFTGALILRFRP